MKFLFPGAIAAPEGTIDPELDLVAFWNGDEPVAALTFYASHPQSHYGEGGITPDTVGLGWTVAPAELPSRGLYTEGQLTAELADTKSAASRSPRRLWRRFSPR